MKKLMTFILVAALAAVPLAGCGSSDAENGASSNPSQSQSSAATSQAPSSSFDSSREITVISREDGSGTRGAFVELLGIEEEGADGSTVDRTTDEAVIARETNIVINNVVSDEYAIGYISLGSLNDTVKALKIDGVEATAENIKSGDYKVSRPFNIATKGEPTGLAKDFIDFIMSAEGQEVVGEDYIKIDDNAPAFEGTLPSGKIVIGGSSSVTPVMEKLVEAYQALNPEAEIEIQMTDSTAGMTAAIEGTCDIGMASRELKESELAELTGTTIASDGIAIIVNPANPLEDISTDAVKSIYVGDITTWDGIAE